VRHEVAQIESSQGVTWRTRHVPAGPYAGVLPLRWWRGAKPCGQRTETGSNGDKRAPRGILPR